MRKTILQFIPSLNDGGAETLVKDYCILGNKDDICIKIVTYMITPNTANYSQCKKNNVEIIHLYKKWNYIMRVFHKIFGSLYIPLKLKKLIEREQPVALHLHMKVLKYVAPLSNYIKKRNVRLFYTCHSLPEIYFGKRNIAEKKGCIKMIHQNNLQMIGLHEDMKKEIDQLFGIQNTIVIRNGVNFERFKHFLTDKKEKKSEIKIPNNSYVVGHVGRFDRVKNHEFLIKVFKEIHEEKKNAHLLLIGSGELEYDIRKQIKKLSIEKHVTLLSNRTDIPELLNLMDVFVFPSFFEGISVTLIEAQVSGLYCVVSNRINKETYCCDRITELSLNAPIEHWVKAIIEHSPNVDEWRDIADYDMNREVLKVIELYID